jgi:vacuolar protein sorting-associated protein 13A/C
LEKKLSYEDLYFYRSLARSQARKEAASRKKLEIEQQKTTPAAKQSWTAWLWGSPTQTDSSNKDPIFGRPMTDEQRKELYDVLDYDEKSISLNPDNLPDATLMIVVNTRLKRGTLALRRDPHGDASDVVSLAFETFEANFVQRHKGFDVSLSLQGFGVIDGTAKNTVYRQIVQVKQAQDQGAPVSMYPAAPDVDLQDPFFFIKFEAKPLEKGIQNALTVRMRYMEIVYHKGFVETMDRFLKPPDSQPESVEALFVRSL